MSVGPNLGTAIADLPFSTDAQALATVDPYLIAVIAPIESETYDAAMATFSTMLDQRLQDTVAEIQVTVRQQAIIAALTFGDVR